MEKQNTVRTLNDIWSKRSKEELHEIAQIKRFLECLTGDPAFRLKLEQGIRFPSRVAKEYGVDVDAELMLPLFNTEYSHYRFDRSQDRWPLAQKWDAYLGDMIALRHSLLSQGSTTEKHPRFDAWRNKQISRVRSELGDFTANMVHPIACYELSEGCTLGCWFCGISAAKFKGHWPFTKENQQLWRGILEVMVRKFGDAAGTGFCYWATDPTDNPDYIQFLRLHGEIAGRIPQTTTAAPLRDADMTREILKLSSIHNHTVNRFSILSVGQLRRVHATFSADELLGVEMVMQQKGSLFTKALAGRAFMRAAAGTAEESGATHKANATVPSQSTRPSEVEGTIACVSGFLVNMVSRTVKLMSPTVASAKYPNGYKVFGEYHFDDVEGFERAIDGLIDFHMAGSLLGGRRLAFRKDLDFLEKTSGFSLSNKSSIVDCNGADFVRKAGALISGANKTVVEAIVELASDGTSPFLAIKYLEDLEGAGVLDEEGDIKLTAA